MPIPRRKKLKSVTIVSNYKDTIKAYIEKKIKKNEKDNLVSNLNEQLSILNKEIDEFYVSDGNNNYKTLDEEDKKNIVNYYNNAITACNNYLKTVPENEKNIGINKIIANVQNDLLMDYRELNGISVGIGKTLPEILSHTRDYQLDVSKVNFKSKTLGGNLSSRHCINIDLNNGKSLKGMFTQEKFLNYAEEMKKIFDEMSKELDREEYKNFALKNDIKNMLNDFSAHIVDSTYNTFNRVEFENLVFNPVKSFFTGNTPLGKPITTNNYLHIGQDSVNKYNKLYFDFKKNNNNEFVQLRNSFISIATSMLMNFDIGIENHSNIELRNSSATNVAQLLGRPDLLANSVPISMKDEKGNTINGNFMEFSDYEDISHMKKDTNLRGAVPTDANLTANSYSVCDKTGALKDLADLQIIDYIIGNQDRHAGNIMYKYEKNENGEVKLVGIKGIDNDSSFGQKKVGKNGINRLPGLSKIKVISESMAKRINELSPEILAATLKGKLLKEDIQEAVNRLNEVKDAVQNGKAFDYDGKSRKYDSPEKNEGMTIVSDRSFKNLRMSDLFKSYANAKNEADKKGMSYYYNGVFEVVHSIHTKNEINKSLYYAKNSKPSLVDDVPKVGFKAKEKMEDDFVEMEKDLTDVVKELNDSKLFLRGSNKFDKMLKNAEATLKGLQEFNKRNNEISPEIKAEFKKGLIKNLNNLYITSEDYLTTKQKQGSKELSKSTAIKRINASLSAINFVQKYDDRMELSSVEAYKELNAENKNFGIEPFMAFSDMSLKECAVYIKSYNRNFKDLNNRLQDIAAENKNDLKEEIITLNQNMKLAFDKFAVLSEKGAQGEEYKENLIKCAKNMKQINKISQLLEKDKFKDVEKLANLENNKEINNQKKEELNIKF